MSASLARHAILLSLRFLMCSCCASCAHALTCFGLMRARSAHGTTGTSGLRAKSPSSARRWHGRSHCARVAQCANLAIGFRGEVRGAREEARQTRSSDGGAARTLPRGEAHNSSAEM
eukprot:7266677-Prymnesium_polylepis.2